MHCSVNKALAVVGYQIVRSTALLEFGYCSLSYLQIAKWPVVWLNKYLTVCCVSTAEVLLCDDLKASVHKFSYIDLSIEERLPENYRMVLGSIVPKFLGNGADDAAPRHVDLLESHSCAL
ncbi:hypothetical protein D3C71_1733670 [compost metagenome]